MSEATVPQPDAVGEEFERFRQRALDALVEITPRERVGKPAGHLVISPDAVSLRFETLVSGYRDWFWTVTLGRASADDDPTVLEINMLPSETSLQAPRWIPWAERFAEYQASIEAEAEGDAEANADADSRAETASNNQESPPSQHAESADSSDPAGAEGDDVTEGSGTAEGSGF